MADAFDPTDMVTRFSERSIAVKQRQLPPVEGEARKDFMRQARLDFQDFAMIADADCDLTDGILTLRIDLRPRDDQGSI